MGCKKSGRYKYFATAFKYCFQVSLLNLSMYFSDTLHFQNMLSTQVLMHLREMIGYFILHHCTASSRHLDWFQPKWKTQKRQLRGSSISASITQVRQDEKSNKTKLVEKDVTRLKTVKQEEKLEKETKKVV